MYAADETKGSRVSIPYMPKPLDLPISTVENLSPPLQSKMTSIEEEEDFINNNYVIERTRTPAHNLVELVSGNQLA
jgi:hypothetical protein